MVARQPPPCGPSLSVSPEFVAVGSAIEMNYFFSSSPFPDGAVVGPTKCRVGQYHASLRHLSRAVFVNFGLVESPIPPVGEVEARHVEHKHWIVPSPAAPEHVSPCARETVLRNFHSCFSLPKESSTIHFIS